MSLALFLRSIAWPIVVNVLISMGMGTVTYIGLQAAFNQLVSAAKSSFSGVAVEILQILALAGFFTAMSIVVGAMVTRLSLVVTKKMMLRNVGS
jgi:hypothetical protein